MVYLFEDERKGTEPVEFDFEVFKELSNYERTSMNDFYLALKSVGSKLGSLSYKFEDESYYEQLWLFQRFAIDKENKKIIIQANERFEFILNSIGTNFTRFELENVTKLTSGYSKNFIDSSCNIVMEKLVKARGSLKLRTSEKF